MYQMCETWWTLMTSFTCINAAYRMLEYNISSSKNTYEQNQHITLHQHLYSIQLLSKATPPGVSLSCADNTSFDSLQTALYNLCTSFWMRMASDINTYPFDPRSCLRSTYMCKTWTTRKLWRQTSSSKVKKQGFELSSYAQFDSSWSEFALLWLIIFRVCKEITSKYSKTSAESLLNNKCIILGF